MITTKHFFLAAGLALLASPALADTPIDQTRPLASGAQLDVSNVKGAVIVRGWDKHEVHVTGSLGANTPELEITGDAKHLSIKIKNQGHNGWLNWGSDSNMGPTRLELSVPRDVNLDVNVVSARAHVDGLAGGNLDFDTVSGNLEIHADSPALKLNSVSGDVRVEGHSDKLDVNTVSGDVHVQRVGHDATAQTVSGNVTLTAQSLRKLVVDTVSGDIDIQAGLTTDATARMHSMSGDIRLTLDGRPDAELAAKSMSGDIHSAFGKVDSSGYGPGTRLSHTLGAGSGHIRLESLSGDIDIRQGH